MKDTTKSFISPEIFKLFNIVYVSTSRHSAKRRVGTYTFPWLILIYIYAIKKTCAKIRKI